MIRYSRMRGAHVEEVVIDAAGVSFSRDGNEPVSIIRTELDSESTVATMAALMRAGWTPDQP